MKQPVWAWIAGGAVFAVVLAVWAFLLPGNLRYVSGGKDFGFAGLFSSVRETGKTVSSDLSKLQGRIETGLKGFDRAMAETAQAQALDDMKKKIETDAVKKKLEAALTGSGQQAISDSNKQ